MVKNNSSITKSGRIVSMLFLTIILLLLSIQAKAATYTWNNAAGGNWTTTTNWTPASPAGGPTAGSDIILNNIGANTITNIPIITLNSITCNGIGKSFLEASASGNTITISTTFLIPAGFILTIGTSGARINLTLANTSTATINGGCAFDAGSTARNFTVNGLLIVSSTGSIYDPSLSVGSFFVLNAGATMQIAQYQGIWTGTTVNSNVAVDFGGGYTYSSGANYVYNGSVAQTTGNGLPASLSANLTINNPSGVILSQATSTTATGIVTLTSGYLITTGALLTLGNTSVAGAITGYSATNYIMGPLARTLLSGIAANGTTYIYPVADAGGNYRPLELLNIRTGATAPVVKVTIAQNWAATADCGTLKTVNSRNWLVGVVSGNFTSTTIRITESGLTGTSLIGSSAAQTGNYTSQGGNAIGATIASNAGQVPGAGAYYAVGSSSAAAANAALSDNGTQVSATSVPAGTTNLVLHQSALTITGNVVALTGLTCTTAGTYASVDITNIKAWYSTSNTFNSGMAFLLSTFTTPGTAGAKTFPAFSAQSIPVGSGYIYITADIAPAATVGNNINVNALATGNFTFYNTCFTPTKSGSTTAGGTQTFSSYCGTLTWKGAGAGGASGDLNLATNWLPVSVSPNSCHDLVITTTTAATLSVTTAGLTTVNSVSITNNGNVTLVVDVQTNSLTINQDLTANDFLAGTASSVLSLRVGANGSIVIGGNTYLGNNGNIASTLEFMGTGNANNTTGIVTFKGNVTFGAAYNTASATNGIGTLLWDGTGTQTIYTNNQFVPLMNANCKIGSANTPSVIVSNTYFGGLQTYQTGHGLTISAGATLDLNTTTWNQTAATGVFTNNGTLRLGDFFGGQAGSNFPLNYTTSTPVLAATSLVEYYGSVNQTIYSTPTYGNLTLTNSATRTPTAALIVAGALTINSTATFAASTFTHNFKGNFINNGTFTASTSTSIFSGTSLQTISGTTTTTFNNITISNAAGVTLATPANVSTALALTTGLFNTDVVNILTMQNGATAPALTSASTSYVNGPMIYQARANTVNTILNFPIGKSPDCRPVILTVNHKNSSLYNYQAESFNAAADGLGYTLAPTTDTVSGVRYWTIDRTDSAAIAQPNLNLNGNQKIQMFFGTNDFVYQGTNLTVVKNTSATPTQWYDVGGAALNAGGGAWVNSGVPQAGSVSSTSAPNTFTSFSTFTLGSKTSGWNSLPIKLLAFTATPNGSKVDVAWTTENEVNNKYFTVERSSDGQTFTEIATKPSSAPKGNSTSKLDYQTTDTKPLSGTSYYRLKQTDYNGKFEYFKIVPVNFTSERAITFTVYPNPNQGQFTADFSGIENNHEVQILLNDEHGKLVYSNTFYAQESGNSVSIIPEQKISKGVYFCSLIVEGIKHTVKVVVE